MADYERSENKVLKTNDAAGEVGLQPDQFRALAYKAGLQPRKAGRYHLWSEADVEVVRGLITSKPYQR